MEGMVPDRIRKIRLRENTSWALLACYLDVTKGLFIRRERNGKRLHGSSLKILMLVSKKGFGVIA